MSTRKMPPSPNADAERWVSRIQSRRDGVAVLCVELPPTALEGAERTALEEIRRRTSWPGFRRGGAPLEAMRERFSAEIRKNALGRLIQEKTAETLARHDVVPIGAPLIQDVTVDDAGVRFRISTECAPEAIRVNWRGLDLRDPGETVTDEDVERFWEERRWAAALIEPAERADDTSIVLVEASGRSPEARESLRGSTVWKIDLREPGVDTSVRRALTGARAGERKELTIALPSDGKEGAAVKHKVSLALREIHRRVPPANDEAWARAEGFADAAAHRAACRGALVKAAADRRRRNLEEQIAARLIEDHPVQLPPSLLEAESRRLWAAWRGASLRWDDAPIQETQAVREETERRLTLTYLISRIGAELGLEPGPAEVRSAYEHEVAKLPAEARSRAEETYRTCREEIASALLADRVFAAVVSSARWNGATA